MEVAWKWIFQRSGLEGPSAFCAPASSKIRRQFTGIVYLYVFTLVLSLSISGSCLAEDFGEIEHVVEHEQHHEHQVGAETEQGNAYARSHRHGAEAVGVDLGFRRVVERVDHHEMVLE